MAPEISFVQEKMTKITIRRKFLSWRRAGAPPRPLHITRLRAGATGPTRGASYAEVHVAKWAGRGGIWDIDFDLNFFDFHWGLAELVMKMDIDDPHLAVPLRIVGGCLPLLQRAQADLARSVGPKLKPGYMGRRL